MKKVININFQGRVIPIEESAFDTLKQYIDSLRRYFAAEEGREEIINDIQDRIGELFNDCLKNGATCVTDEDLQKIINNMGRPEDFEAAENAFAEQVGGGATGGGSKGAYTGGATGTSGSAGGGSTDKGDGRQFGYEPRGRLYRNDADKVLGGVCSGLANYLRIDPAIVRILFVLMVFGSFGAAVLVYLVLWIVLPTQSLETNVKKRLFRNPDDRLLGGVCGGIAAYLNIEVWIPRLIFAAPFLLGIVGWIARGIFYMFSDYHGYFTVGTGFGGTLTVIYIILWAVVPEARSASEKLEMRGAKIDLESIKATVQEELQTLKEKAVKAGGEMSQRAQAFGEELKSGSSRFAKEAGPAARRTGSGAARAIGMLFKIIFLGITALIAFCVLMVLLAVLFATIGAHNLADLFVVGFWPHFFLWSTLALFIGIPAIAIVHWFIRMMVGRKSQNNYLRYMFATLWILGLVSAICLAATIVNTYKEENDVTEKPATTQPSNNRMVVRVKNESYRYRGWWWGVHLDNVMENDADNNLHLFNVHMNVTQSPDANYHVELMKQSFGSDLNAAANNAQRIQYAFTQDDSVLYLSRTLELEPGDHFHGQNVKVNVLVPIGKHIYLDESVDRLDSHSWRVFKNKWDNNRWDDENDDNSWDRDVETGVDYIMTKDGLVRADGKVEKSDGDDDDDNSDDKPETRERKEKTEKPEAPEQQQKADTAAGHDHKYRYHEPAPAKHKNDTTNTSVSAAFDGHEGAKGVSDASQKDIDRFMSPGYRTSCTL